MLFGLALLVYWYVKREIWQHVFIFHRVHRELNEGCAFEKVGTRKSQGPLRRLKTDDPHIRAFGLAPHQL